MYCFAENYYTLSGHEKITRSSSPTEKRESGTILPFARIGAGYGNLKKERESRALYAQIEFLFCLTIRSYIGSITSINDLRCSQNPG